MNDSDGRVDGVAAAWSRFDSLARRADARVLTTTASRWSRDDAIFTTTIRVMRLGPNGPKIEKRDHPRPSFPETIHDDGVRRGNTYLLLLHVVPFVPELVVRLRVPQEPAADAPGLPSLR